MKKSLYWVFLALFSLPVAFAAPTNLSCAKQAIIAYYDNLSSDSAYLKDVDQVVQDAENYLNKRVIENTQSDRSQKLAMVLDIDETSLSNFSADKAADFGNLPDAIDAHYHEANSPAIAPVRRLYNEAIAKGVTVFFITSRKPLPSTPNEDLRACTIANLQNAGYAGWKELYLAQGDDMQLSAAEYKTKIRKMITGEGYDIILNLGDQDGDLVGGYADHTDKIPNPLYSTSPTPCTSGKCH